MNYVSILRCNAVTAVGGDASPLALGLRTAGANPSFASTQIVFTLPDAAARLTLEVHDLAGRRVRTLYAGPAEAGERRAEWNGRREDGRRVPPGIYFAHLRVGNDVRSLRLVRL
jgi:flagellar basal-body rod modification protein FlgD